MLSVMSLPEEESTLPIPDREIIKWFKLTPIIKAIEILCARPGSRSLYSTALVTRHQLEQLNEITHS
jgi:hypothetical protein